MEIKISSYSEVYLPMLAKHFLIFSKKSGMFADLKIKHVFLCGKILGIEEGKFFARILIEDHTGIVSFLMYTLTASKKFSGFSEDVVFGEYAKAYCLTRVEEDGVTLVLKYIVKVNERAEVNNFIAEVMIHHIKACGFRLSHLVLKELSDAPANGLSSKEIQSKLSSYYSLYHIEKVILELTEEGQVTIGDDFNKYILSHS
jgi:hypothetical protein